MSSDYRNSDINIASPNTLLNPKKATHARCLAIGPLNLKVFENSRVSEPHQLLKKTKGDSGDVQTEDSSEALALIG